MISVCTYLHPNLEQKIVLSDAIWILNPVPESLLESFPCKLNTFRKRKKNEITSHGIQEGL
jgi:hypothetical protein